MAFLPFSAVERAAAAASHHRIRLRRDASADLMARPLPSALAISSNGRILAGFASNRCSPVRPS
jgi:hypothetical protein